MLEKARRLWARVVRCVFDYGACETCGKVAALRAVKKTEEAKERPAVTRTAFKGKICDGCWHAMVAELYPALFKETRTMGVEEKYGRITTERGRIPEGEPVFLLRAQDVLAADAVRYYAKMRADAGDADGAQECRNMAVKFDAWPVKKQPD